MLGHPRTAHSYPSFNQKTIQFDRTMPRKLELTATEINCAISRMKSMLYVVAI